MTNQPRLVNRTPVNVEENWARPAVSMIPQMAIRPVKMSAMSSNGFLNTVSPFRYINEVFINTNYYREIVKKRVSHNAKGQFRVYYIYKSPNFIEKGPSPYTGIIMKAPHESIPTHPFVSIWQYPFPGS
jgi:hypothetical protein